MGLTLVQSTYAIHDDVHVAVHDPQSGRRLTYEVGGRACVLYADWSWEYRPSRMAENMQTVIDSAAALASLIASSTRYPEPAPFKLAGW